MRSSRWPNTPDSANSRTLRPKWIHDELLGSCHSGQGILAASAAARSPLVAPGGTGGRIRQWQPTQIEPESASRLLPTMRERSGETPSRSHAVRKSSGAGLAMPRSQERTNVWMKASSPVAAYPALMFQPVLLTIAIGIPAPLNAFRTAG